jgi:hypothetical protein
MFCFEYIFQLSVILFLILTTEILLSCPRRRKTMEKRLVKDDRKSCAHRQIPVFSF